MKLWKSKRVAPKSIVAVCCSGRERPGRSKEDKIGLWEDAVQLEMGKVAAYILLSRNTDILHSDCERGYCKHYYSTQAVSGGTSSVSIASVVAAVAVKRLGNAVSKHPVRASGRCKVTAYAL